MNTLFLQLGRLVMALAISSFVFTAEAAPKKVLVVGVTIGFPHSSVPTGIATLKEIGEKSGAFTVTDVVTSGPRPKDDKEAEAKWLAAATKGLAEKMSAEALKNYDAVIFENTTGDLPLPDPDAFIAWVKSGKAFIGMHSATDTFHKFPAYIDMIGGEFKTHGAQVKVECLNQDPAHPATKHFGKSFVVFDEIYQMKNFYRDRVHGLLTLDKHPNTGEPGDYPIAWCKDFGAGKVFYTSLGHREDVWKNEMYQQHILGGIKWALGLEAGDAKPQTGGK